MTIFTFGGIVCVSGKAFVPNEIFVFHAIAGVCMCVCVRIKDPTFVRVSRVPWPGRLNVSPRGTTGNSARTGQTVGEIGDSSDIGRFFFERGVD